MVSDGNNRDPALSVDRRSHTSASTDFSDRRRARSNSPLKWGQMARVNTVPELHDGLEVNTMMYGWDFSGSSGWLMLAGMAIIAIAILGSVWLIVQRGGARISETSTPVEILRERFARGEITREQFEDAMVALV